MLFIDPDACVDCGACIPKCPVQAIYEDLDLPDELNEWIDINERRAKLLPIITAKEAPYEGAEERKKALGF
jgi:ferredoxin